MDRKQTTPMTPFDNLISNEQLQMMKLMLPYMPPGSQKLFAVYVKFLELQHTMHFFQDFHTEAGSFGIPDSQPSPSDLFRDISPYMSEKNSTAINQMMQMFDLFSAVSGQALSDDAPVDDDEPAKGVCENEQQSEQLDRAPFSEES